MCRRRQPDVFYLAVALVVGILIVVLRVASPPRTDVDIAGPTKQEQDLFGTEVPAPEATMPAEEAQAPGSNAPSDQTEAPQSTSPTKAEHVWINVNAADFAERVNATLREHGIMGDATDLGCDAEQGGSVCKFFLSPRDLVVRPGSTLIGTVYAKMENAPVKIVRLAADKNIDTSNFGIAIGVVMTLTDPDMSRELLRELALDLLKRFLRGSNQPEVDGRRTTYKIITSPGGQLLFEARARP